MHRRYGVLDIQVHRYATNVHGILIVYRLAFYWLCFFCIAKLVVPKLICYCNQPTLYYTSSFHDQ